MKDRRHPIQSLNSSFCELLKSSSSKCSEHTLVPDLTLILYFDLISSWKSISLLKETEKQQFLNREEINLYSDHLLTQIKTQILCHKRLKKYGMDTYHLKLSIHKVFMKRQIRICGSTVAVTNATIVDNPLRFAVNFQGRHCYLPISDHVTNLWLWS